VPLRCVVVVVVVVVVVDGVILFFVTFSRRCEDFGHALGLPLLTVLHFEK
jgi:hypothetical protein